MAEARTSKVHKRVRRLIQTAQFESVEVACEFEEEIEWTDMDERNRKSDAVTKLLIIDLQRTMFKVLDELGLDKERAFGKRKGQ